MANPLTDLPNDASKSPTWSFHERYASDAEFKRQVDEARMRSQAIKTTQAVTSSLAMPKSRTKLY